MHHYKIKVLFPVILAAVILALPFTALCKDFLYIPGANMLQILDCEKDVIIKDVPYTGFTVSSLPSPDGKRFYMNNQRLIYVVDTDTNEIVDTYTFWSDLNRITVNPAIGISEDGSKLYMSCHIVKKKLNIPKLNVLPPQLVVFDTKTKEMIKNYEIIPMCHGVFTLRNDPDKLFLFGQDICTLDLKSGKIEVVKGLLHPEPGNPQLNSLVNWNNQSNGDNGLFTNPAYTATFDKIFYAIIDRNTGKFDLLAGKEVVMGYSTVVSPDKKFIYTAMDEVYKIDFKTGETLGMDILEIGTHYALSLTADGKKLYVGGASTVSVYDTETMKLLTKVPVYGDVVTMNRISK